MKKEVILNLVILVVFIALSIFVGANHEPWSDEAQSWLIARDATVGEILCTIERYEGTPPLWHLLLKVLINLGYKYEYLYLISVFFSSLGVVLLLFKLKLPNVIKILLPFTYFFLYEYTVKARSYCLIFPLLVLIAIIYKDRKEKVILYNFLLAILASISLHSALISGILYLSEVYEIFISIIKESKVKKYIKSLICSGILGIFYGLILFCIIPTEDVLVSATITSILSSEGNIFLHFVWLFINLLEAFTLNTDMAFFHFIISSIYFVIMIFLILRKNKKKVLFLSIFLGEVLFILLIRVTNHHIGLMLYAFLFALYLVKDEIIEKNKKLLCIMLIVMFVIQILWSVITIIPEIKYNYSAAQDVSQYLKEKDYKNMKIYSTGYYSTAILPYFDNNIFYNDRGGTTYYRWGKSNADWSLINEEEFSYRNENNELPDIIILHDYPADDTYEMLIEKVRLMNEYKEIRFDGNQLYKGIRDLAEEKEYEGYYVFERVK